ncbi:hypothetical protein [Rhodovulum euryhalinum]|uniref:Copper resistance protein B n=1 Tax=Rhodovulum euryhalinum TaxID=35805 RepID=A0A4R2KER4_9RHOB|nr:hypothetical protein [Rhodovulum euryhalinum]TCO72131.1 hypothetical protein EV655_105239 [Rhodovulum euryhalinum]
MGIWLAAAGSAAAGAWLREDGAAMLAFSHEVMEGGGGHYTAVYGEYGLSERLTIGIDAGIGAAPDDWKAVAFARMGREFDWLPGRVAAEIGLGAAGSSKASVAAIVQPGLSWGHSFETGAGWAWVNLDAKGVFHLTPSSEEAPATTAGLPMALDEGCKIDLTLGLNLSPRSQLSLEMRFEDPAEGARSLRLVPGIARRLGTRGWVTLGGIVDLRNDGALGLVLGSRIDF